ncbi:MAG: Na+/H+ antiporter subunit C [Alphaproteobacteria bacterium]
MEPILAVLVGILIAVSIYMMMSGSFVRIVLGILVLSNAANLLIFTAGRLTRDVPPIIPGDKKTLAAAANSLPQALILTAIVISFSLFAFILVLAFRSYREMGTVETAEMRIAEPHASPPDGDEIGAADWREGRRP